MHFRNGRPAKEGDHVIAPVWRGGNAPTLTAGVIHGLQPSANSCNATLAYPVPGGMQQTCITLGDSVHAEDAFNAVPAPGPVESETGSAAEQS